MVVYGCVCRYVLAQCNDIGYKMVNEFGQRYYGPMIITIPQSLEALEEGPWSTCWSCLLQAPEWQPGLQKLYKDLDSIETCWNNSLRGERKATKKCESCSELRDPCLVSPLRETTSSTSFLIFGRPKKPGCGPLARSSASCIGIREEERPFAPLPLDIFWGNHRGNHG